MNRHAVVVALLIAGTFPGLCQRGGARGGGGLQGHGVPVLRGGMAPAGRSFVGSPQYGSSRRVGVAPNMPMLSRGMPMGGRIQPTVQRHVPMAGRGMHAGRYDRRRDGDLGNRRAFAPFVGVGVPYGIGGLFGPGFLGYPDSGFYGDAANTVPAVSPVAPIEDDAGSYDARSAEQAETAPSPFYRRVYERSQPAPESEAENAVTLVFKDGRPSEEIHNYMLTRTTLYVQDEHRREISVDEIDLTATQKANKDAGVEFRLPGSRTQ